MQNDVRSDNDDILLFVYGSMRKGLRNNTRLNGCEFLGNAQTEKKYSMFPSWDYGFPYVFEGEDRTKIKGEVYKVPREIIETKIDHLEGVALQCYKRRTIEVWLDNGTKITADIYFAGEAITVDNIDCEKPITEWTKDFQDIGDITRLFIKNTNDETTTMLIDRTLKK